MKGRVALGAAAAAATAVAAGGAASATGASPGTAAQACTPKQNIEAIIDDSGSMGLTDPSKLRVQALNLLMSTPGNEQKLLGAVEFGTDAAALFPPAPIGQWRAQMLAVLNQRINADNESTDYNDAFALAQAQNPAADARIFLTDGAPTEAYSEGHRGGPATFVIGLGFIRGASDEQLLGRIAAETGGRFARADSDGELQAAMNSLNAAINCQSAPVGFRATFTRAGQAKRHRLKIPRGTRSVQFAVSWTNASDRFAIGGFRIVRGKRVLRRKPHVAQRRGPTFVTAKATRLKAGRLVFRVKAKRISTPGVRVKVTTQASRSGQR